MKTLTLKKPDPAAAAAPAPAAANSPVNPQQEGIYVSSRHRNPLEDGGAVKPENWTLAGVLAIVSAVLLATLLAVSYMDWSALSLA